MFTFYFVNDALTNGKIISNFLLSAFLVQVDKLSETTKHLVVWISDIVVNPLTDSHCKSINYIHTLTKLMKNLISQGCRDGRAV